MKFNTRKLISGFLAAVILASSFPNLTANAVELPAQSENVTAENLFTEEAPIMEDGKYEPPAQEDGSGESIIPGDNAGETSSDDGSSETPSTDDDNGNSPTDGGNIEPPSANDGNIENPSTDNDDENTPSTDDNTGTFPSDEDGTEEKPSMDNGDAEANDENGIDNEAIDGDSDTVEDESAIIAAGTPETYQYVAFPDYDDSVIFTIPDKAGTVLLEQADPRSELYMVDPSIADEFEFEAAVRSDYRLEIPKELTDVLAENGSRQMKKGKWVYKYFLTVSGLSTTLEDPIYIQLIPIKEAVRIDIDGKAVTSGIDENGMALIGDEVSIEVITPGCALALHTKDKYGNDVYTAMELNYDNQYTFIAEKEVDFIVVDPEQTDFVVAYADTRKAKLTGTAGLKLNSLASSAQGYNEIVLNFTAVKNGSDGTETENAYYEVKVIATPKAGAALPAGSSTEPKYYYIPKTADINTQSKSIKVNDGDVSVSTVCTYAFSTRLVLISKTASVPSPDTALESALDTVLSGNTLTKSFSTKELYYEDNLKFTKKNTSIYTGQQNMLAGLVKYSKKASYLHDLTAVAYDSHGAVCNDIKCTIKNDNDELYISANYDTEPGKYKVVVYSGIGESATTENSPQGGTMYQSNTSFTLTVNPSIHWIDTADITKQAVVNSSKNITFKAVPVGYSYWTDTKTKNQKFTYEVKPAVRNSSEDYTVSEPTDKFKESISVSSKGIVTVKKGYSLDTNANNNYIAVVIKAADYEGNIATTTAYVQLAEIALVPTDIYLVDSEGKKLGTNISADKADYAQVVVEDQNGNNMNEHVTITPTDNAKHTTGIYVAKGFYADDEFYDKDTLVVRKLGTVKIKAVSKDGSKKSKTVTFKISTPVFSKVSLCDTSVSDGFMWTGIEGDNGIFSYSAPRGSTIRIQFGASINGWVYPKKAWYDWGYSVTGGKLSFDGDFWCITPTEKNSKITIWRKSNPNRTWYATFTNNNWGTVYENAPKITLTDGKIYSNKYSNLSEVTGSVPGQILTYKYEKGDYDALKIIKVKKNAPNVLADSLDPESRTFTLAMSAGNDIKSGSYKYKIAFYKNDIMMCKPVVVTIKVNKASLVKFTSSYTLKTTQSEPLALKCSTKDFMPDCNTTLLNGNTKGKSNDFSKYFELTNITDQQGKKQPAIRFKASVTAEEKAALKGKSLTGYVKYSYYYGESKVDGATSKITIKIK